jgi:uncharacterized transporter YbjL
MDLLLKIALTAFVAFIGVCIDDKFFHIINGYSVPFICRTLWIIIIGSILLWLAQKIWEN